MGFWDGVADWLGINPDARWYQNLGAVLSGGFYQADEDYSSAGDYFNDQVSRLFFGPVSYGLASEAKDAFSGAITGGIGSLFDIVSDLSENVSSIEDMKDVDSALAGVVKGESPSEFLNAIMQYFSSPGNEADAQREFNREEADRAVERARELRQTQYQDVVSSLKAAGLNPVLAAGGGIGGSSSAAPMATSSAAQGTRAVDIISSIALLLQALTGGISDIADAFGSHKTVVNKVLKK